MRCATRKTFLFSHLRHAQSAKPTGERTALSLEDMSFSFENGFTGNLESNAEALRRRVLRFLCPHELIIDSGKQAAEEEARKEEEARLLTKVVRDPVTGHVVELRPVTGVESALLGAVWRERDGVLAEEAGSRKRKTAPPSSRFGKFCPVPETLRPSQK